LPVMISTPRFAALKEVPPLKAARTILSGYG
jgi:hypothetical protein